jgi:TP901 family phage tail tape measure protein
MAREKIGIEFDPVITAKVDAALSNIKSKAKQVDFSGGATSLNKLTRPLGKITGQADEFRKSLEASNARVLAFGASVAVINKLSQAFGALVSNTIKVEATFAKINTILGGTKKEIEQFGSGIFAVAKNTGTAFDQVAEGALELARQGLSVEQSLERVSTALKLVRVAGIDSEKAVSGITAAFKGFEGSGLTVAQIGDRLSQVDTKFATSTESLIEGLKRSSSSARASGVSFNELLAIITTVEERTQRGGAVIGNAFKTIFTRTKRADVLETFSDLGIAVLDSEKKIRPFIPLMEDLKKKVEELGGVKSLEGSAILEKVAGARQIENLLTLFEDLGNEGSKFTQVLEVIGGSVGSLDAKNEALNVTLEALINNVKISAQEFSSILGNIGFADAAKDLLSTVAGAIDKVSTLLQGDSIGSKFAKGLVSGIGAILTGPGLALVGAIFVKLFVDLAKFGVTSLKSLLGVNKAAQEQNILQKSILQTLLQNEDIQRRVLSLSGDKAAQELALLKIYNQQAASLARVQQVAATVTPALFGAGLRGGESGVRKPGGRAADGYVSAESRDVSRGVGGAPSSSKVVSIPNFAFGGGKRGTMVANSSEYFVPNYAGGGDAIFNRNMVRTMGLPSGAKKLNAAGGFIPNFANAQQKPNGKPAIYNPKFAMVVPNRGTMPRQTAVSKSGQSYQFDVFGYSDSNIKSKNQGDLIKSVSDFGTNLATSEALTMTNSEPSPGARAKLANAGSVSSLAGVIFEAAISSLLKSPEFDGGQTATFDFIGDRAVKDLSGLFPSLTGQKFVEAKIGTNIDINKSMANKIEKFSGGGNRITDAASKEIKGAKIRAGGTFSQSQQKSEFGPTKRRSSRGFIPNFAGDGFLDETVTTALEDAISREKAAGLSVNQIRINQSGKLRNSKNPEGLAVTNTRDEPTGRIPSGRSAGGYIPNFAAGDNDASKSLEKLAKSGDKLEKSNSSQLGTILALQTVSFGLSSAFGTITEESSGFAKRLSDAANAAQVFITTLITLQTAGLLGGDSKAAIGKLAGGLASATGIGKGAGALKAGFGAGKSAAAAGVGKAGVSLAAGAFSTKAASTGGAAVLKTLFKLGAAFSRFLPVIGPLILGFTALNGLIKVVTGTSGIGLLTSAFGKSAKAAEAEAAARSRTATMIEKFAKAGDIGEKQKQKQIAQGQIDRGSVQLERLKERETSLSAVVTGGETSKQSPEFRLNKGAILG